MSSVRYLLKGQSVSGVSPTRSLMRGLNSTDYNRVNKNMDIVINVHTNTSIYICTIIALKYLSMSVFIVTIYLNGCFNFRMCIDAFIIDEFV